jgi:hypothetical protein
MTTKAKKLQQQWIASFKEREPDCNYQFNKYEKITIPFIVPG